MKTWLNTTEYPFKSHYYRTKYGKLHYVDEGKGNVILFIHGTPTWSFLYRNYIKTLSSNYRCIAIDNIGFGFSDKPTSFSGTPEDHSKILTDFINSLNLKEINLVVHDFGGPIGLNYAINNYDNIKSLILFNTWFWETKSNKDAIKINKILNSWLGVFLYLNTNFSMKILFKKAFFDSKKLSKQVHQHYSKLYTSKRERQSLLKIGKSLIGSSDWYQENWNKITVLTNKPTLFLWGDKDNFIKPEQLKKWQTKFVMAKIINYDCGHFVQEEKPNESLKELISFINDL